MRFFQDHSKLVQLELTRDLSVHLKRGHPWVFRDALRLFPPGKGVLAKLKSKKGETLAFGIYDSESNLAFRVLSLSEKPNDQLISERLQEAINLRSHFDPKITSAYRLLHGEGDLLPGVVADLYDQVLVIRPDGKSVEKFWNFSELSKELVRMLPQIKGVYLKPKQDPRDESAGKILWGEVTTEPEFLEYGVKFSANIIKGSKTGFFLDQREHRELIRKFSHNKNVLNVFSYTGGFSVYAGLGGAKSVVSVDIAPVAVDLCQRHWEKNGLSPEKHQSVAQDAFVYLKEAKQRGEKFDLIIVDPPSFVPSEKTKPQGMKAYIEIFSGAMKLLKTPGLIAFSSCSAHINEEEFKELCRGAFSAARKRGTLLYLGGQPMDHPRPLAAPELAYLKFALFYSRN